MKNWFCEGVNGIILFHIKFSMLLSSLFNARAANVWNHFCNGGFSVGYDCLDCELLTMSNSERD